MDKLTVLNDALAATGNQTLTVLNDGTDEWLVANRAFDRAVRDLASRHNWPFGEDTQGDLAPADPAVNPSLSRKYAYLLPPQAFHVTRVVVQRPGMIRPFPTEEYEIIGRYLCLDFSEGIGIEFMTTPDDAEWHPQAAEILTSYVEAGCLRGLNEDYAEASNREARAEGRLLEARPRIDRQNPVQNGFNTSTHRARYRRMGGGQWR